MSKKRVLFVTQEMSPYSAVSEIATFIRKLTQKTNEKGFDVRILMPKYGSINERRHKLHEVVRLSGMNIIVDDEDYPLIIKVASLPGARLQVYFLDNEEFFKRNNMFEDEEGVIFEDNQERSVFFCKSALETVKKFGWAPDIVHCSGWMTSLIPLYLKTVYKDDPIFTDSKVVFSGYNNIYEHSFSDKFMELAAINNLDEAMLAPYSKDGVISPSIGAIHYSDAILVGSENLDENVLAAITASGKPTLEFSELEEQVPACIEFFDSITPVEEEEEA
jgi:starch synthase